MKRTTDKEIDEIYKAIDALIKAECFGFLDSILKDFIQRIWRTDRDILLAYSTSTLSVKSKLPSRKFFVNTCKTLYNDEEEWKELD